MYIYIYMYICVYVYVCKDPPGCVSELSVVWLGAHLKRRPAACEVRARLRCLEIWSNQSFVGVGGAWVGGVGEERD